MKAKFPEYDQTCVSETAAVAVAAIASNSEEGSGFKWIPDEKSTFRSPSMSSTLGTRCLALEPMACNFRIDRSIISNGFGREKFGAGSETFWRRIIDDPSVFMPELWQLFLQSNLTALGEKCCPVCVGMTWRRLRAAGTMRQWQPLLE